MFYWLIEKKDTSKFHSENLTRPHLNPWTENVQYNKFANIEKFTMENWLKYWNPRFIEGYRCGNAYWTKTVGMAWTHVHDVSEGTVYGSWPRGSSEVMRDATKLLRTPGSKRLALDRETRKEGLRMLGPEIRLSCYISASSIWIWRLLFSAFI
jgi:hypothetical protein